MLFKAQQDNLFSNERYFCFMKELKPPKRIVLAKAVLRPDNLVWLAVLLMLFTFFRVLYYL